MRRIGGCSAIGTKFKRLLCLHFLYLLLQSEQTLGLRTVAMPKLVTDVLKRGGADVFDLSSAYTIIECLVAGCNRSMVVGEDVASGPLLGIADADIPIKMAGRTRQQGKFLQSSCSRSYWAKR